MSKDSESAAVPDNLTGFVPAAFARDQEEAQQYRELLEDHDIPAIVGQEDLGVDQDETLEVSSKRMPRGVPVLVPEVLLAEAGEVIADRDDAGGLQVDQDADLEDEEDEFEFTEGPDEKPNLDVNNDEFLEDEGIDQDDDEDEEF
jgi:hypothetical protein